MATSKPRITVTLEQDVYDTLQSLSRLQGRSMSSIVSEFLTMANPIQQKVLAAIQRLTTVQESSKADLLRNLESGQQMADSALAPLLQLLDQLGGLPPHSNTGVTLLYPPAQNPVDAPAKPDSRASATDSEYRQAIKRLVKQKRGASEGGSL